MSRRFRRPRGREIDGILVLDKPAGLSSNEALQRVKQVFQAAKAGHTGSLDPLATGVLPLCFGEATKFSQYLLDSDKRYWTRLRLGIDTDSGDADGKVIAERPIGALDEAAIERALAAFRGEIEQVPSMFSAVKHNGQPLYKLARQGIEVERKARTVTIHENRLVAFDGESLELEIHCSKGTYVRNIAEDLGNALGCGAHVTALRRLNAGPFSEADAYSLDAIEAMGRDQPEVLESLLLGVDSAVRHWPAVRLVDMTAWYLRQGQPVVVAHAPTSGWVRLMEKNDDSDRFIGVGEILDDGRVAPRRLVTGGRV